MVLGGKSVDKNCLKTVTALYSFPMALQPCAAFLAHAFPLVPSIHTLPSAVCYQIMRENYSQQELPQFQQDDSLFSTTSYLAVKRDKCCSSCRKKYISTKLHVTTLPLFKFSFSSICHKTKYSSSLAQACVY